MGLTNKHSLLHYRDNLDDHYIIMTSHEIVPLTHFTSDGRELQHVYCLVEHRGVVGDIDKHGDLSLSDSLPFPDEVVLEESGQLALSEWYNMLLSSPAGENTRYL